MTLEDNPEPAAPLEDFRLFAIVGTWLEADVIGATVANALAQGCERVYLIDNDSPDDTVAVAVQAGATLLRVFRTSQYDEETRIALMNEAVAEVSAGEPDPHIWWLWLDADEFPHGSRGRTVRAHLAALDRRFRVVGARYFNHYPAAPPHYEPGRHPLAFQPLCEEFVYPMCPAGHRKHPLQRFDRHDAPIRCGLGAHTAVSAGALLEPTDPIFLHHFPFREQRVTRGRLSRLCEKSAGGLPRGRAGDEATDHIYVRFRSLEAVYRGDWAEVENFMTEPVSRGVTLAPWTAQVGAEDAAVLDPGGGPVAAPSPLLTICVCTRNRPDLLRRCLESMLPELDPSRIEVVVVDNGSPGAASRVVEGFASRTAGLRCVHEPRAGLSHARNRGWQEGAGDYVGYIDDDAVARPGWLKSALEVAASLRHDAFGGPYFAYYDSVKPAWYRDEYYSHVQGDVARPLQPGEYLDGTNLFVRRALLAELGGFDARLGMQGATLSYGEETDLLDRLRRRPSGASVWYDPRVAVDHLVPAYKMKLGWIARSAVAEGRVNCLLFETTARAGWRSRALQAVVRLVADWTIGVLRRDRDRFPLRGEFLYDRTLIHCRALGVALEQGRGRRSAGVSADA